MSQQPTSTLRERSTGYIVETTERAGIALITYTAYIDKMPGGRWVVTETYVIDLDATYI